MTIPALLTAAELRAQCRVDDTGEDATLLAMGAAAERHIEAQTGHVLTRRQEFIQDFDFPHDAWELVRYPVHAVTSITYTDPAGVEQTLSPSVYWLRPGKIAQIKLRTGQEWPEIQDDSIINIQLDVGYPAGVEQVVPLKRACLLLAAHFYANRETVAFSASVAELPFAVSALIADYRLKSLA